MDASRAAEQDESSIPLSPPGESARPAVAGTGSLPPHATNKQHATVTEPAGHDQQPDPGNPVALSTNPENDPENGPSNTRLPDWSSIVNIQLAGHNTIMFRKMGNTLAWVLHYEAKNIQTLYQQAQKYYKERGGTQSLGDLPADWERLLESQHHTTVAPGSLLAHDSEYRIMEALSARFRAYYELIVNASRIDRLPKASRGDQDNFLGLIHKSLPTDPEARAAFDAEWRDLGHDFVTIQPRRIHVLFEKIIYSNSRSCFRKMFMHIFGSRSGPIAALNGTNYNSLDTDLLDALHRTCLGLCCIIMLMPPVAILILADLSKAKSFAVMVCFGTVFMFGLGIAGLGMVRMILGFCAYVAVLTACIANLQ